MPTKPGWRLVLFVKSNYAFGDTAMGEKTGLHWT
jgi:hypothetical protein